ncbi:MAG TPA: sugar ABC transporter substrate-binding protein [Candidatus Methylomirabilis sp.]|nr:sugar ABC transporter substrate-binding protein [Candidatus Methylomirabilis sp.]
MKRLMQIAGLVLVVVMAFSGSVLAKDAKDTHVALVVKDLTNRFFVEMKWGGEAAGKQHGIKVTVLAPEKYAVDNQIRVMEDLIQKKVDAIVIVPIDGAGIVSGIERANKAKIPVFNLNTLATGGEVIGFAGIDHVTLGRIQAEWAVETLKGKGKVVILEGTAGASSAIERQEGVLSVLKKVSGISILASTTAKYNRQQAMKVMEDLLTRFPEIDMVLGANDAMALGAKEAIKDARRKIMVVGIDAIPEALEAIEKGEMAGTVDSNGFDQGFVAVDLTARYLLKDQKPPKDTKVGSGMASVITKDNALAFEKSKVEKFKKFGIKVD